MSESYAEPTAVDAEDPDSLRRHLASVVNHELRTPLSAVVGNAELLADLDLPDQARKSLDSILRAGERLMELAAAVTQIVELDAATSNLEHTRTDVAATAAEVADSFASRAKQRRLTIRVVEPTTAVCAHVDHAKVRQAVVALVKNAVERAPAGSSIDLQVSARDDRVAICVSDRGTGLLASPPARPMPILALATRPEGDPREAGVALAVASAVAQAHGGSLVLTDNVPTGLRARLELPRTEIRLVG